MPVTQVGGQDRDSGIDVNPFPVPPQHRLDGECMAEIVQARNVPQYDMKPAPWEWAVFDLLSKGRKLPGRSETGLTDFQRHLSIALGRLCLKHGTGFINAEMGSGKTTCGIAIAEYLRVSDARRGKACPEHGRRAQTAYPALVVGPGIVTGAENWPKEIVEVTPGAAGRVVVVGAKPLATAVVLLSPPVLHGLLNGSIDWIAAFGLILPPQIGLLFVAVKPQIGVAVMIYWLAEAWREGWKKVIRTFWPITVLFLLSLALFGPWPIRAMKEINLWWNASLWPASIPVGLGLLAAAMRTRKMGYAMAASPCLSPYVLFHSWIGALLAIVPHLPETIAATVGLWLLVGIQALR